ncbi:MAG: hypothetical protein EPO67_14600 [Reyranella sp.]|nr:MAG: hypothetical protein EPO67_14600 [Reyranella sp.]
MASEAHSRLYALVKATPALHEAYDAPETAKSFALLRAYTQKLLQEHPAYQGLSPPSLIAGFDVVGAPSKAWKADFVGKFSPPDKKSDEAAKLPDELIIVYSFASSSLLQQFQEVVGKAQSINPGAPISSVGVDLAAGTADHWCPGTANLDSFSTRRKARRAVVADALTTDNLLGQNVNVVIVDQGLHRASLPTRNWGGGLGLINGPAPGSGDRTSHGMMIARTILDMAPDAVLYDVPLIPPERIASIPPFLSVAQAAYFTMLLEILIRRPIPPWTGPWIFVNAWAIFDRATETSLGDYTENKAGAPFAIGHPLINMVKLLTNPFRFDVVFAAGNCGDFCASPRCGKRDRGPGHSIWGANALREVITAGAVSAADTWIGASSQGPGPNINGLAREKPDLCAPSHFRENDDASLVNSGTSTACAMAAGAVAALRSKPAWDQRYVSPASMRTALIGSARKTLWPGWNERLGHGILNVGAAMGRLPRATKSAE